MTSLTRYLHLKDKLTCEGVQLSSLKLEWLQ